MEFLASDRNHSSITSPLESGVVNPPAPSRTTPSKNNWPTVDVDIFEVEATNHREALDVAVVDDVAAGEMGTPTAELDQCKEELDEAVHSFIH